MLLLRDLKMDNGKIAYEDIFEDGYIDLFGEGALVTVKKLMQRAHGGRVIEGGLDWPVSSGLSRAMQGHSDLHADLHWRPDDFDDDGHEIAFGTDLDYVEFSASYELTPPTHVKEEGPSDTTAPFHFAEGERSAPGIVGQAIRAYGEVVAVLDQMGQPYGMLTEYMAKSWGFSVEQQKNLRVAVPLCRSHGDALWGGISRTLKPTAYSYGAAVAGVKVTFHGKTRHNFNEHALVDWARISAATKVIVMQVLCDDRERFKSVNRLDYSIVREEIPVAPQKVYIPESYQLTVDYSVLYSHDNAKCAFNFINKARERNKKSIRVERGGTLSIDISEDTTIPIFDPRMYEGTTADLTTNVTMALLKVKDDYDIQLPKKNLEVRETAKHFPDGYKVLQNIVYGYSRRVKTGVPRAMDIRLWMQNLEVPENSNAARSQLMRLLVKVFPKDVFKIVNLYCANVTRGSGTKWVTKICLDCDLKPGDFDQANMEDLWRKCLERDKGLMILGETVAKGIGMYDNDLIPHFTRKIALRMANTNDFLAGFESLIDEKKNYWATRYSRNVTSEKRKLDLCDKTVVVKYQLLYRIFREVKFIIRDGLEVEVEWHKVAASLVQSANNHIRKRGKGKAASVQINVKPFSFDEIEAGNMDRQLTAILGKSKPLSPTYASIIKEVVPRLNEFKNDISDILSRILKMEYIAEDELVEVVEDDPVGDLDFTSDPVEEDVRSIVRMVEIPSVIKPVPLIVSTPVVELITKDTQEDLDEMFAMFMDIPDPDPLVVGFVVVFSELVERFGAHELTWLSDVINQYPLEVQLEEYRAIEIEVQDMIHKRHLEATSAGIQINQPTEGSDFELPP